MALQGNFMFSVICCCRKSGRFLTVFGRDSAHFLETQCALWIMSCGMAFLQ